MDSLGLILEDPMGIYICLALQGCANVLLALQGNIIRIYRKVIMLYVYIYIYALLCKAVRMYTLLRKEIFYKYLYIMYINIP